MILIHIAIVLSLVTACLGQPEEPDAKPLDRTTLAHLEALPQVNYAPAPPLGESESKHIHELIDSLALIDRPDFGLSPTTFGSAFAPLPNLTKFQGGIIQIDHNFETKNAFADLVKLGPKALPFLLEALTDQRLTKLSMKQGDRFVDGMWSAREIGGNPMNEHEWDALTEMPHLKGSDFEHGLTDHSVTVGDVCLAIIGQITGRGYSAVRYQPTACIVINSPTLDPEIARTVRAVWSSPDLSKTLLDALLIDLSTRGIHKGEALDHWGYGSHFQVPAATRLLYYFPDLSAPIIAKRLDALDVTDLNDDSMEAYIKQCIANGVRSMDLIEAVSWSDRPEIREALANIMQRTTDPDLFLECARVSTAPDQAKTTDRILEFIAKLPADEGAPFGRGYHLLIALAKTNPERARATYEEFTKGCMHRRRTVCHAVQETKPAWGCEVLLPLLDDKQNADWWNYGVIPGQNEPRLPIRVCDEAGDGINAIRPEFGFAMQGTHEEMDAKLERIKKTLIAK